ncbi:MAG TPA: cob(I)yrinic acid a,c-diamide adenosyltransferase [Acidimicrobiales bacterium]|nr:cob(I)yrinic acid a,c-diamide adenosyltransferase [Acidimicrobiales bacterium]
MKIYTRRGDDGTTGLLYGGRVRKDSPAIEANGAVDEAQAAIGLARAEADPGGELDVLLVRVQRELYVLMAEVATAVANRAKLTPGVSLVTPEMVDVLEGDIDRISEKFDMPTEFVIPGGGRIPACLDLARTVVRRAERLALAVDLPGSSVGAYLNRLSDLLWAVARWQEGTSLRARTGR